MHLTKSGKPNPHAGHKFLQTAVQGDRVGMCVAGLDAALIERGLATTPGTVPTVHACIAYVRKIKFFKGICKSKRRSKRHVHQACVNMHIGLL